MTQLRFLPATFAASAVFLFSSLSSAIVAPQPGCGTGPACGVGFECTVVGASGCAPSAPCAPGASCPEAEPCVAADVYGCTPAHCTTDAQCAGDMVCHTFVQSCDTTDCACAPDVPNCNCGVPVACDPKSVSICTPRYVLPCQVAADCGVGFTCEEEKSGCSSSGTNGSADPAPGADAAPAGGSAGLPRDPVPACDPQPTGRFQCVLEVVNCTSAAQCPAGWSCEQEVVATAPACAPNTNCAALPAPEPVSAKCRPPHYDGVGGGDDLGTPTSSNGQGTETPKDPPPSVPGGTPTPTPTPEATNGDEPSANESAACQMGHAPASSGVLSLLALIGALFGLQRRRAH